MQFLHVMLRVTNIEKTISFFRVLHFYEIENRRINNIEGKFTLVYLQSPKSGVEIELTHNWESDESYMAGRNFGHLAFSVEDINEICDQLVLAGGQIARPPRDGKMAFVRTPDGISIELLQEGHIVPSEKYRSMLNNGTW